MSISDSDFEKMYSEAVRKCSVGQSQIHIDLLMDWSGKNKLKEVLFDSEEILAVASADNKDDDFLASALKRNALILTNMRLIFISKGLLGTRVKEVSGKQFKQIEWLNDNMLKFSDVKVVTTEKELKIMKEMIYQMM